MDRGSLTVPLESARRLAVTKQLLAGKEPARATPSAMLAVVRELAYVQWDPVSIVAPSHLLSLWNRLGRFRPSDLDRLLWDRKELFLHWTPAASIVLTADFPLYSSLMRRYPDSLSRSWGAQRDRAREFLGTHTKLRAKILKELSHGPRRLGQFQDHARTKREDGEWTPSSDVSLMLSHLLMTGDVMVVGHEGNQNLWGLADRFLPDTVDRTELSEAEFERQAAERALRALGTATAAEINYYFPRGRYLHLKDALAQLLREAKVHRVKVDGLGGREERYIHDRDLPVLEAVGGGGWEPRMSLLPPFDNMVHSSARTSRLFGFEYVREQFLPKEKRRFGTYVLPILWGETFIGRIDPRMDRDARHLVINGIYAEPEAPRDARVGAELAAAIARLGSFVGAEKIIFPPKVPAIWKPYLH